MPALRVRIPQVPAVKESFERIKATIAAMEKEREKASMDDEDDDDDAFVDESFDDEDF